MLGKLMKHELKATSRLLIPLYVILVCITLLNRLLLRFDVTGIFEIINGFLIFLYGLSILSILLVTFILMIMRFYRNLMTDEGYLMFTLPVKTHELINAKLLITLFWALLSIIAIFGSIAFVFATQTNSNMIMEVIKEVYTEVNVTFGSSWVYLLMIFILLCIIGTLTNILSIYASIAIGQLFNGHKLIGSFISYIAIYTVMQLILMIGVGIITLFHLGSIETDPAYILELFTFSTIITAALSIAFYIITNQILKKKLNLD